MLTGLILAAAALLVPQDKVQAQAEIRPVQGSDTSVQVVVDLTIDAGWHIYHPSQDSSLGQPVEVSIAGEGIKATGEAVSLTAAKPHMEQIGGQILMYQWLEGSPRLVVPAELADASAALEAEVSIKFQVCDDRVCLPTAVQTVTAAWNPASPGDALAPLPGQGGDSEGAATPAKSEQEPGPLAELEGEKIKITGRFLSATVPQGGSVTLRIETTVEKGWHIYDPLMAEDVPGVPLAAKTEAEGFVLSAPLQPQQDPIEHIEDFGFGPMVYLWVEGTGAFEAEMKVAAEPGEYTIPVELNWMVCDESVCLDAGNDTLEIKLTVTEGDAEAAAAILAEAEAPAEQSGEDEAEATPAKDEQEPGPVAELKGQEIVFSARFLSATVPQGGTVRFRLESTVGDGWHIYDPLQDPSVPGVPLSASSSTAEFVLAALEPQQEAKEHIDDLGYGPLTFLWVEGEAAFEADMRVAAEPGEYTIPIELAWMVCDESVCLDEGLDTIEVRLTVVEGDPAAAAAILAENGARSVDGGKGGSAVGEGTTGTGDPEGGAITVEQGPEGSGKAINDDAFLRLEEGFWSLIWAAMLAGLATILTPCVFPMIPITVSFFTKRAEQGKGTAIGNATAYTAGIIITFVGLGIGMAAILGASGANQIASNAWVNLAIGGLFVFLAFSLLGFFDIKPPKFLANFASKAQAEGQSKSGYAPVMLMAVAFSVTAFTCTVAFVGTVLGLAATGEWWYATAAMFAYAVVFAMPFFFLALFPNMLQKMPSAGGWMNAVKVSFGYLELIAAWKFLSATDRQWGLEWLTRPVVIILTVIPLVLWAAYMFGLYMTKGDYGQRPPRTVGRASVGVLAMAAAIYLVSGYPKGPYEHLWMEAYLPPEYYGQGLSDEEVAKIEQAKHRELEGGLTFEEEQLLAAEKEGISLGPLRYAWHEGWESALEEAREKNALVFLDFTGITCVNCLRMEGNIFPKEGVEDRIAQMVRAHLYVDKAPYGAGNTAFQEKHFRGANQPYYAVMDPFKEEALIEFEGYDPNAELFAEFLRKGIERGAERGIGVLPVNRAPAEDPEDATEANASDSEESGK